MKNFDFQELDGNNLLTFLAILEESSVSKAAERLNVTQSTVSHTLKKLRRILGDPLFIRSGQGLIATETALSMKAPVLEVLDNMRALTVHRPFDPKSEAMRFVVAANDMQRDIVFPQLIKDATLAGINLSLELRPSGVPSVGLLRDARCDLILTPRPPDAPDLIQQKLFSGNMMVFYDPAHRAPPRSVEEYMAADHVTVQFALGGGSNDVFKAPDLPHIPTAKVTVSNFAGIPPFIFGTDMIATELETMRFTSLRQLAMAPLPFYSEPLSVFMVWHQRSSNDPAHRWLRGEVRRVTQLKLGGKLA